MKHTYIYILFILLCVGCAQITPLTGGKKDTEAPKLLKATPANASLNFASKTIELQFDEYITLKDVTNQFIITPQTKNFPDIEARGKKVIVKFDEALLPNTTYKLSFGNSIIDLRESNNLPNFEYVFSTGSTIDSLKLKGRVLNSTDLKPAAQILIGLYPETSEDSIVYKDKPLYLIRTDEQGQFSFGYLPDKSFRIAGIKDQNKNLVYDGSEEQIASPYKIVNPRDSGTIDMMLFKEAPYKSFIKKQVAGSEYGKAYVVYNKPQLSIKDVKAKGLVMYNQNKTRDTLNLYYRNTYDTLETFISYATEKIDTLYIRIPSQTLRSGRESNVKNQRYTFNSRIESTFPYFGMLAFNLNFPIEPGNISPEKILLIAKGDTSRAVAVPYKLVTDKTQGPVTSFTLQTELLPETNYTLSFLDSAFVDAPQRFNDSTGYKFRTTTPDDYAQLSLKLLFPKKENYLVTLQNEKGQTIDERIVELSLTSTAEKILDYKNLLPGKYFVRVVEDANKNGQFDTGDYFKHKQPEIIFINNSPIKLLAGWEIESEWLIN